MRDLFFDEDEDVLCITSRSPVLLDNVEDPCPFKRLKFGVLSWWCNRLLSPPPVLSEDDIGLAKGPFLSCPNLESPLWLGKVKLSVLFRYCIEAAEAACSELDAESSPETEGKIVVVLTIRPADPADGPVMTGLAALTAGEDEGESFQLEPRL